MATIDEYLLRRFGRKGAIKVGKHIAEAFGIPYPLSKDWMKKHGPREVTPYMVERLGIMAGVKQEKARKIPTPAKRPRPESGPVKIVTGGKVKDLSASQVNPKSKAFLMSYEWRSLRMQALKLYGAVCTCCGASPKTGAVMNVDHIRPRATHPHLALDIDNLQVLCDVCNHGKGNWDQTDWRGK